MIKSVRVGGIGGLAPSPRDSAKPVNTTFSVTEGVSPLSQNARLSTTPAIGLEGMLSLQGIDEPEERDRRARKRAGAMLASLTGLQRAMLGRDDPSSALRALSGLTTDGAIADDPGLGAILREVELRCRIEIARRELGGEGSRQS
jgi:hypothetical protein